jgi:hypothetical protein
MNVQVPYISSPQAGSAQLADRHGPTKQGSCFLLRRRARHLAVGSCNDPVRLGFRAYNFGNTHRGFTSFFFFFFR